MDFVLSDETNKENTFRHALTEIERESLHVTENYGEEIDEYQRELE